MVVGTQVTDCPERSPHTWVQANPQEVGVFFKYRDYQGPRPTKFFESPQSYQLVKQGKLPAVEERLPATEDIMVVNPPDAVGEYGGSYRLTAHFLFLGEFSLGSWYERDTDGVDWGPHIGKSVEHTNGGRTYKMTMRRGTKWDDGAPFTMEDIRFAWEDLIPNKELHPSFATEFRDPITQNPATFRVVDDLVWELTYDTPNYTIFEQRSNRGDHCGGGAGRGCFWSPKHYMGQFVPGIADPAELQRKINDNKVEDWVQLWKLKSNWETNTEKPCMRPWCVETNSDTQRVAARNHYFWAVDPEGNQMPYMDAVTMIRMESRQVAVFRAMAGEHDGQTTIYATPEIPLYASNMEKGDYSLYHWPRTGGATFGIGFNQTFNDDPEVGKWIRTRDFRIAISHATDREELNQGALLGIGVGRQSMPHPSTPYYPGDQWADYHIKYDADLANTMLDDLGLTAKDSEGFRLRTDGSGERLTLKYMLGPGTGQGGDTAGDIGTYLQEQWAKVGIHLIEDRRDQHWRLVRENKEYLSMTGLNYGVNPWAVSTVYVPLAASSHTMNDIGRWYETKGKEGQGPGPDPSFLPLAPPENFPADPSGNIEKLYNVYQEGRAFSRLSPERIAKGKEIFAINGLAIYQVGTVSYTGNFRGIFLNRNNVRNQPTTHFQDHYGYYAWTYYFEDGTDNLNHQGNRSQKYKGANYIGKTLTRE